jgi:hypothetical protein
MSPLRRGTLRPRAPCRRSRSVARMMLLQSDEEPGTRRSVLFTVPMHLAGSLITSFVFALAFIATITAVIVAMNELG